ncbi:MAG: hypothetical protein K6C36_06800, partial [Clostridia bacterium]|nr:hypothetical protein [Clostridia bacterium]
AEGEYAYTLQAEYENGYAPEEPVTVTVTVSFPQEETDDGPDDTGDEDGTAAESLLHRLFGKLKEFFRKLIELLGI